MIVIHGENIIQSRNKLMEIIDQTKNKGVLVDRIPASNLDLPSLESKLQKTDLFGHSRMLVIEELHSLPRSAKKNQLIKLVAKNDGPQICLWEKRKLTKTMLKKLAADQVFHFNLSNSLFDWLDSLSTNRNTQAQQIKLLKQAVKTNDEYMCFVMLARQIRLLIQAKTGGKIKGPYFVINKIKKQAQNFSLIKLLQIHSRLHQLDKQIKTSTNIVNLDQALEILILQEFNS
jgi:DNA polymerase III delta subunit